MPRNVYIPKCIDDLFANDQLISVHVFGDKAKQFNSNEQFCDFLKEKKLGVKQFGTDIECFEEVTKLEYFYNRLKANPNFIQNFTVLAVVDGKMYTQIQNAPCILYKNASGDLEMSTAKAHLEKDHVLPMIYKKCYKFLMEIHKHGIYYGDIKCKNIFVNIENNSQEIKAEDILIGDYGSLRSYDTRANSIINNYVFTFMTPMSESFVKFWRPGGHGYNYGVRTRLREISKNNPRINYIFSTETLRRVKETWQDVYDDHVINESDSISSNEIDPSIFFAKANDWFHFGIAMIEFITFIQNEALYSEIDAIFKVFCESPIMDDKEVRVRQSNYNEPTKN